MKLKATVYALLASTPFLVIAMALSSVYYPRFRVALDQMPTIAEYFFAGFLLLAWVAYFWDIWKNPRMPKEKRKLWTVVMALANWYALPFYWWFYIRSGTNDPITEQET